MGKAIGLFVFSLKPKRAHSYGLLIVSIQCKCPGLALCLDTLVRKTSWKCQKHKLHDTKNKPQRKVKGHDQTIENQKKTHDLRILSALIVTGWLLPEPCTSKNRPVSLCFDQCVQNHNSTRKHFSRIPTIRFPIVQLSSYIVNKFEHVGGGIQIEQVWTYPEGRADARALPAT